jgi:hypothetical protein
VTSTRRADEQYLARRSLRELPDTIGRLKGRLADLSADLATLTAHEHDPLIIGERPYNRTDILDILGHRLDALPEKVRESKPYRIGHYRGLAFGLVLHAGGAAEVFLEGKATRRGMLSRDHRGPRAVLNALDRLADSCSGQCDATAQDLAIAETQLRDYEARRGRPFAHDGYLIELTDLRDQLKAGLSQATPEPSTLDVAGLALLIKALKAAHTIDAAPERTATRRIAAEVPVTARIRRRTNAASAIEPPAEPTPDATPAKTPQAEASAGALAKEEAAPAASHEEPMQAVIHPFPEARPSAPARTHPGYRQHVGRSRRQNDRQLSLF